MPISYYFIHKIVIIVFIAVIIIIMIFNCL